MKIYNVLVNGGYRSTIAAWNLEDAERKARLFWPSATVEYAREMKG